ncbi:unnamed protein product [marine sediment metagenome]|uniref:Uncharacterized protein n=1 Tax=marine sediment metagenome TaxID=412755 RepID=X1UN81_9ZZZZ
MFRLPPNLGVAQQYTAVSPSDVTALEESLPANSRLLVGLVFSERYEGFEEDCLRANDRLFRLFQEPGLSPWPEYPQQFVTPDEDGEPIAWIHYQSSPAWWTILLVILGGVFLLPIIGVLPVWIIDFMFPGFTETIGTIGMLVVIGGLMFFLLPMLKPVKEEVAK